VSYLGLEILYCGNAVHSGSSVHRGSNGSIYYDIIKAYYSIIIILILNNNRWYDIIILLTAALTVHDKCTYVRGLRVGTYLYYNMCNVVIIYIIIIIVVV